jgi:hypothetical protein
MHGSLPEFVFGVCIRGLYSGFVFGVFIRLTCGASWTITAGQSARCIVIGSSPGLVAQRNILEKD